MAYKKKTLPEVVDKPVDDTKEYVVIESYTANINNKPMKAQKGDRVFLTPTQYSVLKRFVL